MTRFGFLLFNLLLVAAIYGFIYFSHAGYAAVVYTLTCFSLPYTGLLLFMAVIAMLRWFLRPNEDITREAITFLHAFWIVILATLWAVKLTGGIHMDFLQVIHKLGK